MDFPSTRLQHAKTISAAWATAIAVASLTFAAHPALGLTNFQDPAVTKPKFTRPLIASSTNRSETNTTPAAPSTVGAKPQVVQFGAGGAQSDETANQSSQLATLQATTQRLPGQLPASPTSAETNLPPKAPTGNQDDPQPPVAEAKFDQAAAFEYLEAICKIGPRVSDSRGMQKQQKFIKEHFLTTGGEYLTQPFLATSPYTGKQVTLDNLMIRWHPERTRRLLICCHHDTRPFADKDPKNPRAKFIGANDGASGVALLCELGKHIQEMDGTFGIDFLFFDGEEFVIVRQRDPMFLGSTFFARSYLDKKLIPWSYEQAILVDMVADKDLQIFMEQNSLNFAKELTHEIFGVANDIGVKEFIPKEGKLIRDDHLPLNQIARIPTCDLIDFDFPNPAAKNAFWHTRNDNVKNCSAESLGKVGSVVLAWLRKKQKGN